MLINRKRVSFTVFLCYDKRYEKNVKKEQERDCGIYEN